MKQADIITECNIEEAVTNLVFIVLGPFGRVACPLVERSPRECPVAESVIDLIHRLEEVIGLLSAIEKPQMGPFLFEKGHPDTEKSDGLGMRNRSKNF